MTRRKLAASPIKPSPWAPPRRQDMDLPAWEDTTEGMAAAAAAAAATASGQQQRQEGSQEPQQQQQQQQEGGPGGEGPRQQ
jgi:hypothetical protein